jgi:hypothetical protein
VANAGECDQHVAAGEAAEVGRREAGLINIARFLAFVQQKCSMSLR